MKNFTDLSPARNLINKFYYQLPNNGYRNEGLLSCEKRYNEAITCAIVCVEEIIKELTEEISPSVHGFRHNYWKEIKQELLQIQNDNTGTKTGS